MKTKLTFFMCLFMITLYAQPYKSYFGKEYNKWYILYDGIVCPNTFNYLSCFNRTTIIDGKSYNLLYEIHENLNDTINSVPENTLTNQYLREDSVSGKLYYRYSINSDVTVSYSPEILVSDLSLNVGDSMPLNLTDLNISCWSNLKKSTDDHKYYAIVDSVYYKDGLKQVRTSALFNSDNTTLFEKPKTALTFIEGIGSNISPILDYNHYAYMSDISKLICNVQDNNTKYFNSSELTRLYVTCDVYGVGVSETKEDQEYELTVSNRTIKVGFFRPCSGSVRLIQTTAIVFYENPFVSSTEQIINANNLQSGVYVLQIINSNGIIINRKIIL